MVRRERVDEVPSPTRTGAAKPWQRWVGVGDGERTEMHTRAGHSWDRPDAGRELKPRSCDSSGNRHVQGSRTAQTYAGGQVPAAELGLKHARICNSTVTDSFTKTAAAAAAAVDGGSVSVNLVLLC